MMVTTISWNKALILSCCLHGLVLLILAGTGLSYFMAVPEQYVEVELAVDSGISGSPAASTSPPAQQAAAGEYAAESVAVAETAPAALRFDSVAGGEIGNAQPPAAGPPGSAAGPAGSGAAAGGPVAGVNRRIMPPRILQQVEPVYPEEARRQGKEGRVVLRIEIRTDGRPGTISVVHSSGSASLDEAAIQAARLWRFVPARDEVTGSPVSCYTSLPVVFKLN